MKQLITIVTLLTASAACTADSTPADPVAPTTTLVAFDTPESALWNASDNIYFVSNIAGESDAADGIGWIAKLDADGEPLAPRWVDGLNAPKGMALSGGKLYVADLADLVAIDVSSGEIQERIAVPGAAFLNDVTASDDTVWVSDTFGGAVFAYTPSTQALVELARDPALATINGLEFDGSRILGGTTGDFFDPDDLGDIVSISTSGEVTVLAAGAGKIDGIVRYGAGFLATDFRGMLLSIEQDGTTTMLMDLATDAGMMSAADLGYDPVRDQVAIPDLFASSVVFIDLGAK